jgi:pteridine reductase
VENMTNSQHKVALVTGAAQRIGASIARELHRADFNIIIHYRHSAAPALAVADELNRLRENSAHCLQADLADHSAITDLATAAQQQWGRLDALVNNASSFYPTDFHSATTAQWQDLIDGNLKGAFFLTQALSRALQKHKGCIINLIDIHADTPLKNHSIYCIAKAGAAMMTKSLARELGPDVRVNGIAPGAILWPENEAALSAQQQQAILEQVPLKKAGEPGDIARTAKFLICDAPYINGQIIAVDGGRSVSR